MAACKLASKGLTLLDSSYQSEVKNIQTFLSMQRSNSAAPTAQTDDSINTHSLVSPRYHKKYKPKQVEWPWKVLASVLQYLIQVIYSVFVLLLYIKTIAYSILIIMTSPCSFQLTPRILEAFQNVAQLSLTSAILKFLQIWQALPDFGISYFMVRWMD